MVVSASSLGASDALVPQLDFTHFLGHPNDTALPVAVANDAEGNIYVAGITRGPGLPTINALQPEYSPGYCGDLGPCPDVFVGKLKADGSGFSYLTYLGGPLADSVSALVVDRAGNAYLAGVSASPEFPIRADLEPDNPAVERPYVLKLSPDGNRVIYATRLPGRNSGPLDEAPAPLALALDSTGAAHVTGTIYGRGLQEVNGLGLDPGEMDVFRSDDRGRTWFPDSRGLFDVIGSFEFTAAASSPQGGAILYAASPYGVFRKQGAEGRWEHLETAGVDAINEIVGLAVDPSAPDRLYVASSGGLMLTADGGRTWQDLTSNLLPEVTQLTSIAIAPSRPATLYLGGRKNVLRSNDGGLTWTSTGLSQSIQAFGVAGLDVDPTDPETVYATVYRGFEFRDAFFKTNNGGGTWRELYDGERPGRRYPVAIDPAKPSTLYVGTFKGLVRSLDGGLSWADRSNGLPEGAIDYVEIDPFNTQRLYAGGRNGLFLSDDGGTNWESVSKVLPHETSSLVIDPANRNRLYLFGMPHPANAYALKLSADGSRLEYATLLGGNSDDYGFDIALDETGRAWVTGFTGSLDFPARQGVFAPSSPGGQDGFVVQLSQDGSRLDYSAYLGGRRGIAVAPANGRNVLLAGSMLSGSGDGDAVLWGLDTRTSEFAEVTRLGGSGDDQFDRIALASDGRVCLRGWTSSEGLFPDGPAQFLTGVFATCLTSEGQADWGSFLGGITAGLAQDGRGGAILAALGNPAVAPFQGQHPVAGRETPFLTRFRLSSLERQPRLDAVLNAGHFTPGLPAPGLIVSLFGDQLGPPGGIVARPSSGRFPSELGGVQVLVNGQPAPLLFVQERQINAVLPFAVRPRSQMRVEVAGSRQHTAALYLTVAPSAPGIFAVDGSGMGQAAVLNEDNTLNSPGKPARRGSIVQIFATGSGAMAPLPQDGFIQPLAPPYPAVTLPVKVEIGYANAEVLYAGAAPGLIAGVLQINARVPAGAAIGPNARLTLIIGDRSNDLPPAWIAVR